MQICSANIDTNTEETRDSDILNAQNFSRITMICIHVYIILVHIVVYNDLQDN